MKNEPVYAKKITKVNSIYSCQIAENQSETTKYRRFSFLRAKKLQNYKARFCDFF